MDEIKNEIVQDVVEETAPQAVEDNSCDETTLADEQPTPAKKKIKLPAWLQKLIDKINSNEDVRQMVLFTLFSFICGGTQTIVTLVLPPLLELAKGTVLVEPFAGIALPGAFNLFEYPTVAQFIGFLIGSTIGQILTFVLNRKKTFNCTNNVVIAVLMYIVVSVIIIFTQTLIGGAIQSALYKAVPEPKAFLALVFNLTTQVVQGIAGLVLSFLGNKFLVMRNWGEKKQKAQACDCQACAADCDSADCNGTDAE